MFNVHVHGHGWIRCCCCLWCVCWNQNSHDDDDGGGGKSVFKCNYTQLIPLIESLDNSMTNKNQYQWLPKSANCNFAVVNVLKIKVFFDSIRFVLCTHESIKCSNKKAFNCFHISNCEFFFVCVFHFHELSMESVVFTPQNKLCAYAISLQIEAHTINLRKK